jgi:hypothetical protein
VLLAHVELRSAIDLLGEGQGAGQSLKSRTTEAGRPMTVVGRLESALVALAPVVTAFAAVAAIGKWSLDKGLPSAMPVSICAGTLAGVRAYQLA